MKLSPTQLRVLRYASEGRLVGFFHVTAKDGDRPRAPLPATVYKLRDEGLIGLGHHAWPQPRTWRVTPKGRALLEDLDLEAAAEWSKGDRG